MENVFNELFNGLFQYSPTSVSVHDFILCIAVSLCLGFALAFSYMFRSRYTKSFVVTLAMLPAVVSIVIIMVYGNLGTGVAVAGVFSLVRFRSIPGTARELCTLFIAMSAGLIVGMGYLGYAILFTLVMCVVFIILNCIDVGGKPSSMKYRTLSITIPEDLDYVGVFDDIFSKYTMSHELIRVKTTNMGSLFRLTYQITVKDPDREKEMIDELRCRNGNLEISVSMQESSVFEL